MRGGNALLGLRILDVQFVYLINDLKINFRIYNENSKKSSTLFEIRKYFDLEWLFSFGNFSKGGKSENDE